MRRALVFCLLLGLGATWTGLRLWSPAQAHVPPPEVPALSESAVDLPPRSLEGPLRVHGLSWATMAPAAVGADPPGDAPGVFAAHDLELALSVRPEVDTVVAALAKGGAHPEGAHIAVMPLPEFAAAYPRLKALDPKIILVVGHSVGREVVAAQPQVSFVDFDHAQVGTAEDQLPPRLLAEPGSSAAFVGLFSLDLLGVHLEEISVVAPADALPERVAFSAAAPGAVPSTHKVALTTADAPGLVPLVAVAPAGFLQQHPEVVADFAQGWLAGGRILAADVPGAARHIATLPDAPDTLALVEQLGQIQAADLDTNARLAGLSGRGALTTAALFERTWATWRAVGLLTEPPPVHAPVDATVIGTLVRDAQSAVWPDAVVQAPTLDAEPGPPLLTWQHPLGRLDTDALVQEAGMLADVFGRSHLDLAVAGSSRKSVAAVAQVVERYGLPDGRVGTGPVALGGHPAGVLVRGVQ